MDNMSKSSVWSLSYFSLLFCTIIAAILVLFYLYIIEPYVMLPADILTWAETCFVGDIIKLHIGEPLYTTPGDSNCNVYTPGAQLLTYAISWIIGKDMSIATWRIIQLCFITCAALLATICCRILYKLAYPDHRIVFAKTWLVFTFFAMFLASTAPVVNANAHTLQSDALSLLISMLCLFATLIYLRYPHWRYVVLMAICPALGYFTKQNLMIWSVLMFVVLVLHNYKNYKHLILFTFSVGLSICITIGICYLFWGDAFIFWTFEIMGGVRKEISFSPSAINISLPRCLDHTIRAWMEIVIGVVGGLFVLQGRNIRRLGPIWIMWILLIAAEALISGINWGPLYHFGPGVVIGSIWLFTALPQFWPIAMMSKTSDFSLYIYQKMKPLIAVAGVLTVFIALRTVPTGDRSEARYWKRHSLSDVYRYISDIEREFEDIPAEEILLDVGNWIYLRHLVLAKDRAVSLADQPPANIYENLDIMVSRIRKKTYSKILVRGLHSPFFPYDWYSWERPSGVRKALLEHYNEIRTIPAVEGKTLPILNRMHVGSISVLVPKID